MGFFCCSEEKARSIFGTLGGNARVAGAGLHSRRLGRVSMSMEESRAKATAASADAKRIYDGRVLCQTTNCNHTQRTPNNPFCKACSKENNKKRKSNEIEIEKKCCLICGRTEDEAVFHTKVYCRSCYKKPEGKEHRERVKRETNIICDERGCNKIAYKGGKCRCCQKMWLVLHIIMLSFKISKK